MNHEKIDQENLEHFLDVIARISKLFSFIERFTGDTGLKKIDLMILDYISKEQVVIMNRISDSLDISLSRTTGLIDRLVDKEMVSRERNGANRRIVKVFLTELGEKTIKDYQSQQKKLFENMMNILNTQEQKDFTKLLEKIADAFDKGSN